MECPKCLSNMESVAFEGYQVERCSQCKGLWFHNFEQEELKAIPHSEDLYIGDPAVGKELNAKGQMVCPECQGPMIRMVAKDQPHIWFESCTSCFGAFFDAGEFRDYKDETLLDYFKDMFSGERK
jgi:Zn-finger nucleic acid-binding protein